MHVEWEMQAIQFLKIDTKTDWQVKALNYGKSRLPYLINRKLPLEDMNVSMALFNKQRGDCISLTGSPDLHPDFQNGWTESWEK